MDNALGQDTVRTRQIFFPFLPQPLYSYPISYQTRPPYCPPCPPCPAYAPYSPYYPYSAFAPVTVRAHVTTVAGLGQAPAFEDVGGLQHFPRPLAESIATNLAAMIWVPTLGNQGPSSRITTYTAYSPGSYEVNFGAPPPAAPGYPGEATTPGVFVLADPSTVAPADALSAGRPLDRIDVAVAPNSVAALDFASLGGSYGVVLAPTTAPVQEQERRVSPALIAGLAAAAVAALVIFA